jgi:MFS transporter, NNP family, nitrate/nitrite transporter
MFTKEVVGTANALAAGWGNLGAGAISLIMGAGIFPLFKLIFNGDANLAWRYACIVPAVIGFTTGVIIYFISDDAPKGNYAEMKKNGIMPEVSAAVSFRDGAVNFNTWILFVQYAACFGVELTMNNAAALYFKDQFGLTTESAAAIASIFGWMNLFARGLGGYICDKFNQKMGMKGRILINSIFLVGEGVFILIFANSTSLAGAIVVMIFFSLFVQAAEGSTFGIVPYIKPEATGSVSGIVGAGGNVGAVLFGLCFRQLDYKSAFYIVGGCVLASAVIGMAIVIKGQSSFICGGEDTEVDLYAKKPTTLAVPEVDEDANDKE